MLLEKLKLRDIIKAPGYQTDGDAAVDSAGDAENRPGDVACGLGRPVGYGGQVYDF